MIRGHDGQYKRATFSQMGIPKLIPMVNPNEGLYNVTDFGNYQQRPQVIVIEKPRPQPQVVFAQPLPQPQVIVAHHHHHHPPRPQVVVIEKPRHHHHPRLLVIRP